MNLNHYKRAAIGFIGVTTLLGCGTFATENRGKKQTEIAPELAGTWATNCRKVDDSDAPYVIEEYAFNPLGDFTRTTTRYTDETCKTKSLTHTLSGTFSELGKLHGDIKRINFTIYQEKVRPETKERTDELNSNSACGISDWKEDEARETTTKSCLGFRSFKKGDVAEDVYQVKNGERLYLGRVLSPFTDKDLHDRPDNIDTSVEFQEQ